MLSLGAPKISFQFESAGAHERLLEAIKSLIPEEEEEVEDLERADTPSQQDNNQLAFQVCL